MQGIWKQNLVLAFLGLALLLVFELTGGGSSGIEPLAEAGALMPGLKPDDVNRIEISEGPSALVIARRAAEDPTAKWGDWRVLDSRDAAEYDRHEKTVMPETGSPARFQNAELTIEVVTGDLGIAPNALRGLPVRFRVGGDVFQGTVLENSTTRVTLRDVVPGTWYEPPVDDGDGDDGDGADGDGTGTEGDDGSGSEGDGTDGADDGSGQGEDNDHASGEADRDGEADTNDGVHQIDQFVRISSAVLSIESLPAAADVLTETSITFVASGVAWTGTITAARPRAIEIRDVTRASAPWRSWNGGLVNRGYHVDAMGRARLMGLRDDQFRQLAPVAEFARVDNLLDLFRKLPSGMPQVVDPTERDLERYGLGPTARTFTLYTAEDTEAATGRKPFAQITLTVREERGASRILLAMRKPAEGSVDVVLSGGSSWRPPKAIVAIDVATIRQLSESEVTSRLTTGAPVDASGWLNLSILEFRSQRFDSDDIVEFQITCLDRYIDSTLRRYADTDGLSQLVPEQLGLAQWYFRRPLLARADGSIDYEQTEAGGAETDQYIQDLLTAFQADSYRGIRLNPLGSEPYAQLTLRTVDWLRRQNDPELELQRRLLEAEEQRLLQQKGAMESRMQLMDDESIQMMQIEYERLVQRLFDVRSALREMLAAKPNEIIQLNIYENRDGDDLASNDTRGNASTYWGVVMGRERWAYNLSATRVDELIAKRSIFVVDETDINVEDFAVPQTQPDNGTQTQPND